MANKHSSKSKHKKKHKKEKSKHKKEKKSRKDEKERRRKYSSSSSSSNSSADDVKASPKQHEWNLLESALTETKIFDRDQNKTNKTKDANIYDPKHNVRELNPYWRENGTGLPPNSSAEKSKNLFLKPGEGSATLLNTKTHYNNWRKKGEQYSKFNTTEEKDYSKSIEKNEKSASEILTSDELNTLASKLVKAEILGNKALVEKLKAQLDAAKKAKEHAGSSSKTQRECKEIIVLTESNAKRLKTPSEENLPRTSKKQKLNLQQDYMLRDEKYSINNLFVKEKTESEKNLMMPLNINVKNLDELDDVYLDAATSEKSIKKREKQIVAKSMKEAVTKHKSLEGCSWCLDNRNQTKHLIISTGNKCYLCLPQVKSLNSGHCLIVPIQHEISTRKLDEDVWDELKTYKKVLTKMFSDQEMDVIFFESARSFKHFPHCFIQCVPLEKEIGDLAPIYFQKALSESETEWSNNKKVIDFRNKDLMKSIPKDLPYFAVSFGNEGGFAHIIEDERLFPRNFAEEVIGGMLDLDPGRWRKPSQENFNAQREKALDFLKMWKKYEFNDNSVNSNTDSDSSSSD